ncbi:MAG: metallophosphoesterase [Terrimicrobiaceae bacterium]
MASLERGTPTIPLAARAFSASADLAWPSSGICYGRLMRKQHSWWMSGAALLCGVLVAFMVSVASGKDFTIVALPDTQFYSETYPKIAVAQTDWIVAHKEKLNIVYVAHLGDITNQGDDKPEQWPNAAAALYRLENPDTTGLPGGIPYGVVPGNHDHRGGTGQFNKFFGTGHFAGRPYYGGHFGNGNNSHFDKFTAGGLDYAPLDAWAEGVLKTNPGRIHRGPGAFLISMELHLP